LHAFLFLLKYSTAQHHSVDFIQISLRQRFKSNKFGILESYPNTITPLISIPSIFDNTIYRVIKFEALSNYWEMRRLSELAVFMSVLENRIKLASCQFERVRIVNLNFVLRIEFNNIWDVRCDTVLTVCL